MNFAKTPPIHWRPAQLEGETNQNWRNWKTKASVLHCGGRCKCTSPKLVQRHGNKSIWNVHWCSIPTSTPMRKKSLSNWTKFAKTMLSPNMETSCIPKKRYFNRWQPLGLIGKHCCTLHPTAYCWGTTWSSTFPRIATSKLSNENIRQALTSAFANSGLELTFRQACTADQKGEVEFLDDNHCITTDDAFGFVTEDFVKSTAEGRQFINGKSHHPQSTLKSILFGQAIWLRRLNQKKEDYLSSLNWLKDNAIHSSFPLDMTNDMTTMTSNWEERLRAPNAKRKMTHKFGLHLFPTWSLSQRQRKT